MSDQPFGELGDLIEQLVPIAADLVEAVHPTDGVGPDGVRGVLQRVPPELADRVIELPGGTIGALCVVLAAMVNPDAGIRSLLGWSEQMLPAPALPPPEPTPADRERNRLRTAGVRSRDATEALVQLATQPQTTTRDRMLHVIHGGRQTA